MEYLQKLFKRTGWMSILISAVFAILGAILIWRPDETIKIISYILGIILIVIGISRIIASITAKGKYDLYNYDMIFGILGIILGIVAIMYSHIIITLLNIIVGIWITYTALLRINLALKIKKQTANTWIYVLVLALIMLACGIYIILDTRAIITTIGIILLIYSIIDIIEEIIWDVVNK